jgi:hypothetical protein
MAIHARAQRLGWHTLIYWVIRIDYGRNREWLLIGARLCLWQQLDTANRSTKKRCEDAS